MSKKGKDHDEILDTDILIKQLLNFKDGKQIEMKESQLQLLCHAARLQFLQQSVLLEIEAPIIIVGDLHGQFSDLLRHFKNCGYPPDKRYLFLGDYVDRGKQSLETISLVLAMKVRYPNQIFLLRGNHECDSINRIYGFYDECKRRYSIKLWRLFTDCFNCLPIVALVEDCILCMHGGLSPDLMSLDQLRKISRPLHVPDFGLVCDILWSDPDSQITGWGENDRGVSYTFGPDVITKFIKKHELNLIVRAHQVVEDGYEFFNRRSLVTLFSAPNYCGEFDNAGAVMLISEDLTCSFKILSPNKCDSIISTDSEKSEK